LFLLSFDNLAPNSWKFEFNSSEYVLSQELDNQMFVGKNFIFIACFQNDQNAIIVINPYGFESSILVTQDIVKINPQIAAVFEAPSGHIFVVVQMGAYSDNKTASNAAILQYNYDLKLLATLTIKEFRWFAGHFFSGAYLYVYTYGSQIFRFGYTNVNTKLTSDGVMTISTAAPTSKGYVPIYDPKLMPILGPSMVFPANLNEVILFSQQTGYLFQIHLLSFCKDGEYCQLFYPIWAIALICAVIALFFVAVIAVVIIKKRLKKQKRLARASLILHSRRWLK